LPNLIVAIDHGHFYSRVYPRESIHELLAEDCAAISLLVEFIFIFFMGEWVLVLVLLLLGRWCLCLEEPVVTG
jgi:hypothetical protein